MNGGTNGVTSLFIQSYKHTIGFYLSIIMCTMILTFILLFDKVKETVETKSYFYWINLSPSIFCIIMQIKYIDLKKHTSMFKYIIKDYILLKSIFEMLKTINGSVLIFILGFSFMFAKILKTNSSYKYLIIILIFYMFICYKYNTIMIILFLLFLEIGTIQYLYEDLQEHIKVRCFITGILYFIDLFLNYQSILQIQEIDYQYFVPLLFTYIVAFGIFYVFSHRLEQFNYAFALCNLIVFIAITGYRIFINNHPCFTTHSSMIVGVFSIFLYMISCWYYDPVNVREFPPQSISLYAFSKQVLPKYVKKDLFDNEIIEVNMQWLLPATTCKEKVLLSIFNFKIIASLHILNKIVKTERSHIEIYPEGIYATIDNFSKSYYDAIRDIQMKSDPLTDEIDGVINAIIDEDNDVISKFLYFIGIKPWSFIRFVSENQHAIKKAQIMAYKVERSIESGTLFLVNTFNSVLKKVEK